MCLEKVSEYFIVIMKSKKKVVLQMNVLYDATIIDVVWQIRGEYFAMYNK